MRLSQLNIYKKLLLTCRMHTSVMQRGNVTRLFSYMFITADITVKDNVSQ